MINVHISSCRKGGKQILDNVFFSLKKGEILTLLGPSGAGKSTILRIVAGLEDNFKGHVSLKKAATNSCPRPKISMIFQSLALWPHMTAAKNIAFAMGDKLQNNGEGSGRRVAELLQLLQLDGLGNRYPHTLSGGEQQRLAIARSLAPEPDLLLMDEPFSSLDDVLKLELMNTLLSIREMNQMAILYVTHSIDEALFLADRIKVMSFGKIVKSWDSETKPQFDRDAILAVLREVS